MRFADQDQSNSEVVTETDIKDLINAVKEYYRAVQSQFQRALAKLLFVGCLQNAIQTKVQITVFALNWTLTQGADLHGSYFDAGAFVLGVATNNLGYLFTIFETFDFVKLHIKHKAYRREIANLLKLAGDR